MTERYPEQTPNQMPARPTLSVDELRLALQEWEEDDRNEAANRLRRREALRGIIGDDPALLKSALVATPSEYVNAAPIEDAPAAVDGQLMVDGKPVHLSANVSDAQRKAYIESKRQAGARVEFVPIDQVEPATSSVVDGEAAGSSSREASLNERMGLTDTQESFPLQKKRLDFIRNRKAMSVGATAIVALSLAGGAAVLARPGGDTNDATASVAGPGVVNASAEKEIDMQALISDCAPDKIGAPIASGTMSVHAGVMWSIPGTNEQFPKLSIGAWDHDNDPATEPANEPRFLPMTADNITVSMAVCDPADAPAVILKDGALHVKLSELSPQIAFEAGADNAPNLSALRQEDLNKLVADKWMDQEAANTLRANMTDPKLAITATKEALHGVVEQMKQEDNKTGLAVVAAIKAQLKPVIAKQLPAKSDGKPYEVIFDDELANTRLSGVGVEVAKSEAFAIDSPRIVAEKITPPASEKK